MIKFFKNDLFTNPGDPIHIIFRPVVDKEGNINLEEAGKENTDDIIQADAPSCDIQLILAQCAAGDMSALNKVQGMYGDFTMMPKTYAEMLQLQIDSHKMFESLPIDVKKQFDNDPNKFFVQAGNKEWFEKLGYVQKEEGNIKESEEVKEG